MELSTCFSNLYGLLVWNIFKAVSTSSSVNQLSSCWGWFSCAYFILVEMRANHVNLVNTPCWSETCTWHVEESAIAILVSFGCILSLGSSSVQVTPMWRTHRMSSPDRKAEKAELDVFAVEDMPE
jgi:hypothetical protein